jgi:hypothetical protein
MTCCPEVLPSKMVDEGLWLVGFMQDDLGFMDLEQKNPAASSAALNSVSVLVRTLLTSF